MRLIELVSVTDAVRSATDLAKWGVNGAEKITNEWKILRAAGPIIVICSGVCLLAFIALGYGLTRLYSTESFWMFPFMLGFLGSGMLTNGILLVYVAAVIVHIFSDTETIEVGTGLFATKEEIARDPRSKIFLGIERDCRDLNAVISQINRLIETSDETKSPLSEADIGLVESARDLADQLRRRIRDAEALLAEGPMGSLRTTEEPLHARVERLADAAAKEADLKNRDQEIRAAHHEVGKLTPPRA